MGGADRFSVQQLCNYLRTNLLSSVASMNKFLSCSPVLKADTGASTNFTRAQDTGLLDNVTPIHNGPKAKLPNNTIISALKQGYLPLPEEFQPALNIL